MNTLFGIFILISAILICAGEPSALLSSVAVAGGKAVTLSASLAGMYAFWCGIIKIVEKTPALSTLERWLSPVVSRIFEGESREVRKLITMNISANMLGVGGAATPLAISAIAKMKENAVGKSSNATKSMLILFIMNATSLQILPTTIISLRKAAGSVTPASIVVPTLIASVVATAVGVGIAVGVGCKKQ